MVRKVYRFIAILLFLSPVGAFSQNIVWQENFNLLDGTTDDPNPPSIWTRDVTNATFGNGDYFEVLSLGMEGRDTDGEVEWISEQIDISSFSDLTISIDVSEAGNMEDSDYFRVFYVLDGIETQFGEIINDLNGGGPVNLNVASINGNDLTIIVRLNNNQQGERWRIESVTVAGPAPIYSIGSGDWDDTSIWSYTRGGGTCSCIPSTINPPTITNGNTVNINGTYTVGDLTVESGGILQWTTGGNFSIGQNGAVVVESGGRIARNGSTSAILNTQRDASLTINDGTNGIFVEDLDIQGNLTISGSGVLLVNDDILIRGTNVVVTNDLTGGVTTTDRLHFINATTGNTWRNNGTLSIGTDLRFNGTDCLVTNSGNLTILDDIVVPAGSDIDNIITNNSAGIFTLDQTRLSNATGFRFNNYGTLNAGGNFLNVPPDNLLTNFSGSTFNFGGTNPDPDFALEASATNNLVAFTGGTMNLTNPVSSFYNLEISGGGTKTVTQALDINGYLELNATLTTTFDINLAGDFTASSTINNNGNTFTLDGGNQSLTTIGNSFNDLILAGSGTKTVNDVLTVDNDLTINSALGFQNTSTVVNLGGDFINNGSLVNNDETITFNGTADQTITGATTFANISVSKSGGSVLLESNSSLTGGLDILSSTEFDADGAANNRIFTLEESAGQISYIGSIATGGSISGNVTAQTYYPAHGSGRWRYISLPVLNVPISDLQNEVPMSGTFTGNDNGTNGIPVDANGSLAYYDNPTGGIGVPLEDRWVYYPTVDNTELFTTTGTEGRGYALYTYDAGEINYDVTGPVNQGSIDLNPSSSNERWNLIGNPYPATIDWDAASGWTKTGIQGNAIYIRSVDQYFTWNGSIGSLGNGLIPKGQSFWIQGSQASMALVINENAKSSTTRSHLREENEMSPNIELRLSSNGRMDLTHVMFDDSAIIDFDPYDALKLNNSIFNLSSGAPDGTSLAINAINNSMCFLEVPVFVRNAQQGDYVLEWGNLASLPADLQVGLQDHFLGEFIDLNLESQYSFTVTGNPATKGDERFSLVLERAELNRELELQSFKNCESEGITVSLENSQSSVSYSVIKDGEVLAEANGNGSTLTLDLSKDDLVSGLNQVDLLLQNSCGASYTETVEVNLENTPELTYDPILQSLILDTEGEITWYLNNEEISGEMSQTLSVDPFGGQYHATIETSSCYYTTLPLLITGLGEEIPEGFSLYPNPVTTELFIENQDLGGQTVDVLDIRGRLIDRYSPSGTQQRIPVANLKSGTYLLRAKSAEKTVIVKFIKK